MKKNRLWVVEYNIDPKDKSWAWSPLLVVPLWDKESATRAVRDRVRGTGIPRSHYRVKKYVAAD